MPWPFSLLRASKPVPLGQQGERLAGRYLRRHEKHRILARNYRCPVGEVDIITLDRSSRRTQGTETLVFVEVKTRRSDHFTSPASAVNSAKQKRLRKIAEYYLSTRAKQTHDMPVRFDIVSIVLPETGRPRITHIPNAF